MGCSSPGSDRAASSVVGEVLLVAITVLLAGATATMMIGFAVTSLRIGGGGTGDGGDGGTLPDAALEFEVVENATGPDEVRVTHAGGDALDGGNVYLTFDDAPIRGGGAGPADEISWTAAGGGGTVDAGAEVVVGPPPSHPDLDGLALRVVWRDGSESTVLETFEG